MTDPRRLGKYDIRRQIGKGSMGIVYEGYDESLDRRVAIKVIRQDEFDATQRPELLARLKREARAASRLNHPAVVAVYEYGEDATLNGSEVAYIAMELVDGRELKALFDEGRRFTPRETEALMLGLLGALQHAHEHGVIHRDIKPANVIVQPGSRVKVADFGVARIDSSELTQTGMVLGTPTYMAPEQMLGLAVDGRADLFAAGVILYQFLTGERPFTGSVTTVMQKVLNVPADPPTQRNPALVPAWDAVLDKALAKKPEHRFQSAAEFAAAVQRATQAQDNVDRTVILPNAQTTLMQPVAAAPAAASARWPLAAALLAAVAAAVGGYAWLRPAAEPTPPRVAVAAPASAVLPAVAPPPAATVVAAAPSAPIAVAAAAAVAAAPITAPGAAPASRPAPSKPAASAPKPKASTSFASQAVPAPPAVAAQPVLPPAPPPTTEALEWQAARLRLAAARPPVTLAQALTRLLDLRSADERQRVADLESWLQQRPPSTALVFGAGGGVLQFAWRSALPSPGAAQAQALQRCQALTQTGPAQACRVVWTDGRLDRVTIGEVADGLGERSLSTVRRIFLADLGKALLQSQALAAAAASSAAAAAPSGSPAEPAASPAPRAQWPAALAALRRAQGRQTLAQALGTLLQAESAEDQRLLAQFEQTMQRLPWKSALAMGEQNGFLGYGYARGESKPEWAADRALADCSKVSTRACVVVMIDGKLIDDGLLAVAARLGAKPPAAVREALLPHLRRSVQLNR